jgi:hypothetical protein
MQIKSLQGVEITQTSSHSLEDLRDLSLLSSLIYDMKHTPHLAKWRPKSKEVGEGYLPQQPYDSIYSKNQNTRMSLWAKRKITSNEW